MRTDEELSINQDLRFQRHMWKVERIGWAAIAAVLVAAMAGVFGQGPISRTTTRESTFLVVNYERFGRYQAPQQLHLLFMSEQSQDNMLFLHISQEFLNKVQISRIMPTPLEERATSDGVWLSFPFIRQDGGRVHVTVFYQPELIGALSATVTLEGTTSIHIHQFIYP